MTREQYEDPKRHTLVALTDGKVIGTAGLVEHDVYNVYSEVDIREKTWDIVDVLLCRKNFVGKELQKSY